MKKTKYAVLLGIIGTMALATGVFANTYSVVKSAGSVFINGEQMPQLDSNGKPIDTLNVDGVTYVPLRAITEEIGYNVLFDKDTGNIDVWNEPVTTSSFGVNKYFGDVLDNIEYERFIVNGMDVIGENAAENIATLEDIESVDLIATVNDKRVVINIE